MSKLARGLGMGDITGGPVEHAAPVEIVDPQPVQYGRNPYFPQNDSDEGSPENQGDEGLAAGADEGLDAQGQDEPVPTFDPEQDRAAGIDVDHPYYQKALAEIQRAAASARPAQGEDNDDLVARRKRIEEQTASAAEQEVPELSVSWEGFQVNRFEPENALAGHEDAIARIVREHVEYAISSVNKQNKQIVQHQQAIATRDYISNVVDEIGKVAGPQAKGKALDLLAEFAPLAKSAPQKWARFVVRELGNNVDGQSTQGQQKQPVATPAPQARPSKTVSQIRNQSLRPSAPRSGAMASKPPKFEGKSATAQAVAWALDQALKQQ